MNFGYSRINWLSGCASLISAILNYGRRIISKEVFSPRHFGYIVKKYGVTSTFGSVQNILQMYRSPDFNPEDFSTVFDFFSGGERIPAGVRNFLLANLPKGSLKVGYGCTEVAVVVKFVKEIESKDNIAGGVIDNCQCKILDFGSRRALGPNEVGEVLVKTEFSFSVSFVSDRISEISGESK